MRIRSVALALALLVAAARPAAAEDPSLTRARTEIDRLQFDKAQASLAEAVKSGASSRDELADIYRLSGEVAAALGQRDEAEEHFKRFLSLSPSASLPKGTSPKITRPFETARTFTTRKKPLAIRHEVARTA